MRILPPVPPTSEQLPILADNGAGFRLIKGAAGSGKTTTALMRLRQLCASWLSRRTRLGLEGPVKVLVLAYNRTLEGYITELAVRQVPSDPNLELDILTFGKWARDLVGPVNLLDQDAQRTALRSLCRPMGLDADFLLDEVDYVLGRFLPEDLEDYVSARRTGRGSAPRMEASARRRLLDDVIYPYQAWKQKNEMLDWNDVAVLAGTINVDPWDVIIIDEAQDFSANQVRTVMAHLNDPFSLTFVMDAAQRIYPRFFTWREVGIALGGVYTLKKNYRNTREIAALARSLVEGLPLEDDGNLPDFDATQSSGARPRLIAGTYSAQITYMLDYVEAFVDLEKESVAFLQPRGGRWFSYLEGEIAKRGLERVRLTRASTWPRGREAIALCTLHSAKGLEFDHVLLPGLNQEVTPHGADDGDAQLEAVRRLIAMGAGRARTSLLLGYKPGEESTIISLLDPGTYDWVQL